MSFPPEPSRVGTYDDAMSALYTSLSLLRQNDVTVARRCVEQHQAGEEAERRRQQDALHEQQDNAPDAGEGFFQSIGDFVGDVAGDVAKGHFGSAFDDACRDVTQAWNSPQFWNDLKVGMEYVAIAAAFVATCVATYGTGTTAATVAAAAAMTAVSAGATAGAAEARGKSFAATSEDASAGGTAASNHIQQLQTLTADVIATLKEGDRSHARSLHVLAEAIQTNDQTVIVPATLVRG
jgi:hypothetical protein